MKMLSFSQRIRLLALTGCANRAVSRAADAQLQGSQALWHDARVSVAAEVASTCNSLSTCLTPTGYQNTTIFCNQVTFNRDCSLGREGVAWRVARQFGHW